MQIVGSCLTIEGFKKYVDTYNFGTLPANKLVIHHTWKPTVEEWKGESTFYGIKSYYENLNWSAGPHIFIAPDGIWLLTPMRKNGIHAGSLNWRSIGIEVVGNYDTTVWSGTIKEETLAVISTLMEKLSIGEKDIRFHREVSSKSCPGWSITKEWLFKELKNYNSKTPADLSPWAMDAWKWAEEHALDLTIAPQQNVTAEWVFAILHKLNKS
ncbi:MAG: peptidoglycan recognition family protein [Candidatus Omnitrophota bacterium]